MMDSKSAVDAMLSTMLYSDPSIHSLKPSAKILSDMGVTPIKTAADIAPKDASPEYLQAIQDAMDHGWKVTTLDKVRPNGQITLPGFTDTHGILPNHNFDAISPPNPVGFEAQIVWASKFYDVFDKLPLAILLYCIVELFFLRPAIDFYKEDIEADPSGATMDTVAVFGVRMVAIGIISILTTSLFGTEFTGKMF